jgi:hypothetical protein
VVEHSPHYPKVEDLSPADAGSGKEKNTEKILETFKMNVKLTKTD